MKDGMFKPRITNTGKLELGQSQSFAPTREEV